MNRVLILAVILSINYAICDAQMAIIGTVIGIGLKIINFFIIIVVNFFSMTIGLPCTCQSESIGIDFGGLSLDSEGKLEGDIPEMSDKFMSLIK